ncbi:hypothetical protein [Rickettsiella endosymbiont of Dermanyssus gallinae]|uniref:hypothetical protein n=1 Tax=Rickettsiella endosymbiont of Dermanyssus gallinae TaxID=2856608 RepID=UPI001C52BED7|nr:hypothetical protein [Rickettsiella endosymbiont of Dermanyssus gallinae]
MNQIQAINTSLRAIGEQEIVTLASDNPSVGIIISGIDQVRIGLLATGWWFNTIEQAFIPSQDGSITPPHNSLSIYSVVKGEKYLRTPDGYLFDINRQSKVFSEKVQLKIVLDLEMDRMPEYASLYVANKTAANTYRDDIGVDNNYKILLEEAERSLSLLHREHVRNQRLSTMYSARYRQLNGARYI